MTACAEWVDDDLVPFSFREGGGWYCCYCYPQREFRALAALQALGYKTFLATERKWIRHARYKTEKIVPLLSRYLFVFFDPNKQEWPGSRVEGVSSLLCNDSIPVRVPGDVITAIMRGCRYGIFDETVAIGRLPLGSQLQIMSGPLQGFVAELKTADCAEKRATIFLKMLGKITQLKMKFSELRAI